MAQRSRRIQVQLCSLWTEYSSSSCDAHRGLYESDVPSWLWGVQRVQSLSPACASLLEILCCQMQFAAWVFCKWEAPATKKGIWLKLCFLMWWLSKEMVHVQKGARVPLWLWALLLCNSCTPLCMFTVLNPDSVLQCEALVRLQSIRDESTK